MWQEDVGLFDPKEQPDDCWYCAGEGWKECADPECGNPHIYHDYGRLCPCDDCSGSGKRRE